ncbi:MAG TPA: hypothetical protein VG897_12860 [Terriglobales bacterium]|nr:hypothetical protein [Terriglobales bacterium]
MNFAITIGVRILEVLFFAGWIGSAVVILWSLIDYIRIFMETDETIPQSPTVVQEPKTP